jgi:hypothetical protein
MYGALMAECVYRLTGEVDCIFDRFRQFRLRRQTTNRYVTIRAERKLIFDCERTASRKYQ